MRTILQTVDPVGTPLHGYAIECHAPLELDTEDVASFHAQHFALDPFEAFEQPRQPQPAQHRVRILTLEHFARMQHARTTGKSSGH